MHLLHLGISSTRIVEVTDLYCIRHNFLKDLQMQYLVVRQK